MFNQRLPLSLAFASALLSLSFNLLGVNVNVHARSISNRASTGVQFVAPVSGGGSQLTTVVGAGDNGEPINVIISATSDSDVLVNSDVNGGLLNYFESIGFSGECLGQHLGNHQSADLGDGNGLVNETAVMRWNYGDPNFGTCRESIDGGNHFRYWIQNGQKANTGAIFMAVSYEESADNNHIVIFQGYNLGRDQLLGNATSQSSPPPTRSYALPSLTSEFTSIIINSTSNFTTSSTSTSISTSSLSLPTIAASTSDPSIKLATYVPTFEGVTHANNYSYHTSTSYLEGLLGNTSDNINHFDSVGDPETGVTAIDGLVALLEVRIVARPGDKNAASRIRRLPVWTLLSVISLCILLPSSSSFTILSIS